MYIGIADARKVWCHFTDDMGEDRFIHVATEVTLTSGIKVSLSRKGNYTVNRRNIKESFSPSEFRRKFNPVVRQLVDEGIDRALATP